MSDYVRVSVYRETFEKLSGVAMVVGKNVNDYLREVIDDLYNKYVGEIVEMKIRESNESLKKYEKEHWIIVQEAEKRRQEYIKELESEEHRTIRQCIEDEKVEREESETKVKSVLEEIVEFNEIRKKCIEKERRNDMKETIKVVWDNE